MALLVAAFVATAGVAFAVGRWTMPSSGTGAPSLPGAGDVQPLRWLGAAGRGHR